MVASSTINPSVGWRFFIGSAQSAREEGDFANAHELYKQALQLAENCPEPDVEVAVVLLEMADFCESTGLGDNEEIWQKLQHRLARIVM